MNLYDSHAHIGTKEELEERRKQNIISLLCAAHPPEAVKLVKLAAEPENREFLIPTFGLHPWYSDRYSVADMQPFFSKCPIIGEIGMDSVWCSVPLAIQEQVFTRQLSLACEMKKPVILHTKGQEKRIASLIAKYPNTYLVHWYSSPDFPAAFQKLGCYFSIGPDVWWNPYVRQLASVLPADRILIETDGMSAVKWAYEEAPGALQTPLAKTSSGSVFASLSHTLTQISGLRHLTAEDTEAQIHRNFKRFFGL